MTGTFAEGPVAIKAATSTTSSATSTKTTATNSVATKAPKITKVSRKKSVSGGAIAGIIIGAMVIVVLLGWLIWLVVKKGWLSKKRNEPVEEISDPQERVYVERKAELSGEATTTAPTQWNGNFEPKETDGTERFEADGRPIANVTHSSDANVSGNVLPSTNMRYELK